MPELSKTKLVLMVLCIAMAYIVWGLLLSLMPPFYPAEAEKKGATPSQYGFVFGISSLVSFVCAPIFGHYGSKIGPKLLYTSGALLQAVVGFSFGFLGYIPDAGLFIGISYILRAFGGIADVAAWGAVSGILMKTFPKKVARTMAYTETCMGLGSMTGPILGAVLYDLGGFKLPFIVVGSIAICVATSLIFVIPNVKSDEARPDSNAKKLTITDIAKSPSIIMPLFDNFVGSCCNGMMLSMLEPHLASAGANTTQIGLTFSLRGLIFMLSNPFSGWICDHIAYPSIMSVIGNILMIITFVLVGPLPFMSLQPSYTLILVAVSISGIGRAIVLVSTFGRAQGAASRMGYEKEMNTYLLISGMWTSALYLGSFFGPTFSGFIVDAFGFRQTTLIFFSILVVLLVIDLFELGFNIKKNRSSKNAEYQEMK